MHQKLVRITFILATLCTVSLNSQALFGRENFTEAGDFSEAAILNGVRATQSQCAQTANAVWATPSTTDAECLRYWAAGFDAAPVKRAVVFFHGDVFVGVGKTSPNYLSTSQAAQHTAAQAWARRLGVPYIAIGRPGTHGSSGDHMQRRRKPESEIISAALDQLKTRFGIEEWVVAGQSGGGHVTASLLTLRNDIVCAVPTSSPSSPRVRWELIGRTRDTTNFADSYEPTSHLAKDRMHPAVRVLVLGDPKDKNVFWASQIVLADALKKINVPVAVLAGEGSGPDSHGLSNSARLVAGWCAKDMTTLDIESLAAKGLKG
jgi:pimeloyl-ACP methyl ester carboxylesterase